MRKLRIANVKGEEIRIVSQPVRGIVGVRGQANTRAKLEQCRLLFFSQHHFMMIKILINALSESYRLRQTSPHVVLPGDKETY
jgi:hypothetical protein